MTQKRSLLRNALAPLAVVGSMVLASGAHAAIDTSELEQAVTDIGALGGAAITFAVAAFAIFAIFRRIPK